MTEREQAALEILEEICRAMEMDIRPEPREFHDPYLDVELVGEDAAAAFGRFGKRLDALQYLANLIIGRQTDSDVRLVLDADGYRARRTETLRQLALDYAAEVKSRQQECELDPLPAHERRIIHNTLADDLEIRTYSEGEEPDRRVIIAPR
jgi:spoIIIJ-associated protein